MILVTGASGFIASALIRGLLKERYAVAALSRISQFCSPDVKNFLINDYFDGGALSDALADIDVVVHAAAQVQAGKDIDQDALVALRRTNVEGTLNLAKHAATAGVKRFIFISTVKVNGESTPPGKKFTVADDPMPEDPYAVSKLEAEQALLAFSADSEMQVVIIRPPLVYGPGAKGNFASICKLISRGYPLPLGAIYNKRSLIGIDNLVDLILTCISHPAAANQVFLASDGEDISTTALLKRIAIAMQRPAYLIPVPSRVLKLSAFLIGKEAVGRRLVDSLRIDISKTQQLLGWSPPVSIDEGLRRCFNASEV